MIVAVAHANRAVDMRLFNSGAFDIILSGDDHDLALFFDGRTVMVESKEEAEFVTAIDVTVDVKEKDGKRSVTWYPELPHHRHRHASRPIPRPRRRSMPTTPNSTKELNVAIGTTTEPLDSRKATVRSREAAIGNLIADATREAVKARHRHHQWRRHSRQQGISGRRQLTRRDVLTELPFGNRTVKLEVTGETDAGGTREWRERGRERGGPLPAGLGPHASGRPDEAQGPARDRR